jgi:hypothetical protein
MIMANEKSFKRRFTCGVHVSGHARLVSNHSGKALPSAKERVFTKGVIITMPGKEDDPYTLLDEQSFTVLEAQEEQLTPLS